MTLVLNERGVALHHCDWRALAEVAREAGGVDAVIVDAPYSERCHAGHDEQTRSVNEANSSALRALDYRPWTKDDVREFVAAWAPLTRNWIVSLTDSDLSPHWREAFDEFGLLSFARVPSIESGATVRFNGDGPPNWTVDVMPARTRESRHQGAWKPSAFYLTPRELKPVVGGKPVSLMRALVRDYTRPGDLVCDPCAGAGTLGVACIAEGRRALLGDMDAAHVEIARKRLLSCPGEQKRLRLDVDAPRMEQADLLGKVGT